MRRWERGSSAGSGAAPSARAFLFESADARSRPGCGGSARLRRHMVWRRCPCRLALDFHRDDGAADLLGMRIARHLAEVPPRRRRLSGLHRRPHLLARQVGDVRYGVLVRGAVGREVAKVGNVATNRPSLSRSIVAQYQILYMRLSPHASTRAAPSIVPRSREKTKFGRRSQNLARWDCSAARELKPISGHALDLADYRGANVAPWVRLTLLNRCP